jgi:hypothetical protein
MVMVDEMEGTILVSSFLLLGQISFQNFAQFHQGGLKYKESTGSGTWVYMASPIFSIASHLVRGLDVFSLHGQNWQFEMPFP